jgi:hypothetical protein
MPTKGRGCETASNGWPISLERQESGNRDVADEGRTCLGAATDEPFSHSHWAAGSVMTNAYTAQNQPAQS